MEVFRSAPGNSKIHLCQVSDSNLSTKYLYKDRPLLGGSGSTGGKSINLANQGQPSIFKPEIQMGWGRETWDRTKTQRNESGANM